MKSNLQVQQEREFAKTKFSINVNSIDNPCHESRKNNETKEFEDAELNKIYNAYCFKSNVDGINKLSLNGNNVYSHIGRRLCDEDVPVLLSFLQRNPKITDLNLAHNLIHCLGFAKIIDYIISDGRIVSLNLQNNEIGPRGILHLYEVGEKIQLQDLRLSGNKFGVESSKIVAFLLLKNLLLRRLDVAGVDQTASSLVYFTTVLRSDQKLYNNTLKVLDISRPNPGCMYYFDSAHFASLIGSMLKNNDCLEELHLEKYGFSSHDIEILLMEGRYNKSLLLLNLNNNNVGDLGMECLTKWLTERPALTGLFLAHNIVTSCGATSLSYGIPYSRLKYLDISYNRINDSGVTAILNSLKKNPCMRHFRIYGNIIGADTAKIVNRMLLSGVLIQENLDVKPYVVDNEWFCIPYQDTKIQLHKLK